MRKPYKFSEEGRRVHRGAIKPPNPLAPTMYDMWKSGMSFAQVAKVYGMTRRKAGGLIWREGQRRKGAVYNSRIRAYEAVEPQVEKSISLPVVRWLERC